MSRALRLCMLCAFCSILFVAPTSAQAPNWNDGVCDPLQGGTPGLYGLCIAFCDAHGCVPDFSAADPFAGCKPSDPQLFNLYSDLQQPGDPDLPCINLEGGCPCFTQEQVDALPPPYQQCAIDFTLGGGLATNILAPQGRGGQAVLEGSSSTCIWADSFVDPPIFIFLEINESQAEACREILLNTISANTDDCDAFFCGDDACVSPDTCDVTGFGTLACP